MASENQELDLRAIFEHAVKFDASDVHMTVGSPVLARIHSRLVPVTKRKLTPEDTQIVCKKILNEKQYKDFVDRGEYDFSFSLHGLGRFRVNAYKQRNSCGLAFRVVPERIPSLSELQLPSVLEKLTMKRRGLILVTGPTGSGKSTTLASQIDIINKRDNSHIITIEDPIEYLHKHNKSIVNQREIGQDTTTFATALRAALRQDPDIILVGEMRDLETISTSLTASETGHLVFSTLHTIGSAMTVDRVVDVFPPHQQQQIRIQLAGVLEAVISQQLLPTKDGQGRVAALEVMIVNPAIRNLIREGKSHQIQTVIQTSRNLGMVSMDAYILSLYKKGIISDVTAIKYAVDADYVKNQISSSLLR